MSSGREPPAQQRLDQFQKETALYISEAHLLTDAPKILLLFRKCITSKTVLEEFANNIIYDHFSEMNVIAKVKKLNQN